MKSSGQFGGSVGSKAGGFIAKKFFHPSSFRNQQKVWDAEQKQLAIQKKQEELERERLEEQQVQELRKQMHALSGKAGNEAKEAAMFSKPASSVGKTVLNEHQEAAANAMRARKKALAEEEKRIAAAKIRREQIGEEEAIDTPAAKRFKTGDIKSCYRENVHEAGHTSIWGSWWDTQENMWGYACCQNTKRGQLCPYKK